LLKGVYIPIIMIEAYKQQIQKIASDTHTIHTQVRAKSLVCVREAIFRTCLQSVRTSSQSV
jgi:hypothetical protein